MAAQTNSWASGGSGTGSAESANTLLTGISTYYWDTVGLQWVKGTQPGGGSGGSVTVTNFPSIQPVSLPQVATQYDASAYPVCYLGKAAAGSSTSASVWAIQQLTFTVAGSVSILWAGGNTNSTNAWSSRASLSYS